MQQMTKFYAFTKYSNKTHALQAVAISVQNLGYKSKITLPSN